jgi:hypothetical protein
LTICLSAPSLRNRPNVLTELFSSFGWRRTRPLAAAVRRAGRRRSRLQTYQQEQSSQSSIPRGRFEPGSPLPARPNSLCLFGERERERGAAAVAPCASDAILSSMMPSTLIHRSEDSRSDDDAPTSVEAAMSTTIKTEPGRPRHIDSRLAQSSREEEDGWERGLTVCVGR